MANKCDDVARLKRLAQALDSQFSIGGFKFGLDGIIGLVPVLGDIVTGAIGLYVINEARRLGASRWAMARMYMNWGIDVTIGAVPIVGDIFDIAWKSNTKNLKMLIADLEKRAVELREVNREHKHIRAAAA
jgi:Domain of unknown function (DUF4112)